MSSGFYILITMVRAPSGLVTTAATQPDSLQGEQEEAQRCQQSRRQRGRGSAACLAIEQVVQIMTPSSICLPQ